MAYLNAHAGAAPIRITVLPPYRGAGYDYRPEDEPYYRRVLEQMGARRELVGIDVTIDGGIGIDHVTADRDEAVFDRLAIGVLERVSQLATGGATDAIVVLGAIDVAFASARMVSPIPVVHCLHSMMHMASLLGDRIGSIDVSDPQAARQRRLIRVYQLEHKLAGIRALGGSSTSLSPMLRVVAQAEQLTPEAEAIVESITEQCRLSIEDDCADVLMIGFTPFQILQDDVRSRLDQMGFGSIPVVWSLSAAIAAARAMVTMGLLPSGRAYPSDALTAKPSRR